MALTSRRMEAPVVSCGHHRQVAGCTDCHLTALEELNRMQSALEETEENVTRVACVFNSDSDCSFVRPEDRKGAARVLAALRARAGFEEPPRG